MEVDVNVTGDNGAFVPDLTLDDFEVLDEGKRRPIEVAYVVRSGRVTVAPRAADAAGALPQMSQASAPPSGRRVLVFYFDTTHMNFGQLRRAGDAAEQFITAELNEGDIGGVIVGETMVNNRLTTDRAELQNAIQAATLAGDSKSIAAAAGAGAEPPTPTSAASPKSQMAAAEIDERLKDADKAVVSGPTAPTEVMTLEMLERLVDALARVPGRKNVVFFSAGFSLSGVLPGGNRGPDTLPAMRAVVEHAARSDVHIYSIDVTGLDKGAGSSALLTSDDDSLSLSALNARMRGQEPTAEDVLTSLALDTGGLLFLNQNFYADALKRIDEDSSNYYVLAFRPDESRKSKKGAFRSLRIKVNRPHVTVRARKGYVVE